MVLRTRDEWEARMSVGTPASLELIGEGFTDFSESKNPKEYSRKYIHQRTERSDVIGYAPAIKYSVDLEDDDPVVKEIIAITDGELVGNDAQRDVISINTWEAKGGGYKAWKRTYAIIPDTKGAGTDAMVYSGTMKAVNDFVEGVYNPDNNTFTEDDGSLGSLTVTSAAGGSVGTTKLSVSPTKENGNSYVYKIDDTAQTPTFNDICYNGWIGWDGSSDITAATGKVITLVEVDANNRAKKAGNATVTAKA